MSVRGRGVDPSPGRIDRVVRCWFFDATLRVGSSAYDVYQHMLHPNTYGDPVEEYWALVNDATLWDVAVERIVEITGPDASAFTNLLTCRDLTTTGASRRTSTASRS